MAADSITEAFRGTMQGLPEPCWTENRVAFEKLIGSKYRAAVFSIAGGMRLRGFLQQRIWGISRLWETLGVFCFLWLAVTCRRSEAAAAVNKQGSEVEGRHHRLWHAATCLLKSIVL